QGESFRAGTFDCLAGCAKALHGSLFFVQSQSQYAPGYEANSIVEDPQFLSFGSDGRFRPSDDLRLSSTSPARNAGIILPPDLFALDSDVVTPSGAAPDIGAYPLASLPLEVGVDGRRSYPS